MNSNARVMRVEAIELSPALVPMLLAAAVLALWNAEFRLVTPNSREAFLWCSAILGIVQGLLDRRARSNAFLHHRPISHDRMQAMRTLTGVLSLTAVIATFIVTRWAAQLTLGPAEREQWEQFTRGFGDVDLGAIVWRVWSRVVAQMLLLWAALRFAVSTPGVLAPILLAPFLTGALFVGIYTGAAGFSHGVRDLLAAGSATVLALYHGMRG